MASGTVVIQTGTASGEMRFEGVFAPLEVQQQTERGARCPRLAQGVAECPVGEHGGRPVRSIDVEPDT